MVSASNSWSLEYDLEQVAKRCGKLAARHMRRSGVLLSTHTGSAADMLSPASGIDAVVSMQHVQPVAQDFWASGFPLQIRPARVGSATTRASKHERDGTIDSRKSTMRIN